MKHFQIKWIVLSIGVALLAACSSGGDAPATIAPAAPNTLSITNTIPVAGRPAVNVADQSNTVMSAFKNTLENKTVVQICHDLDQDDDCSQLVVLTINGTTAKTYTIDSIESPTQIVYQDDDATETIVNHYLSTSGQITVTRLDATSVAGTFSATVECTEGCIGTRVVDGNFDIPFTN